jgi:hypothetical protein
VKSANGTAKEKDQGMYFKNYSGLHSQEQKGRVQGSHP